MDTRRVQGLWATMLAFCLTIGGTPIVLGQAVRVRVEAESGGPVVGAIVRLVDSAGKPVHAGLSNEGGRVVLRTPRAGEYRIRADRIGFRGLVSGPVVVADTGSISVELVMPDQPVVLTDLIVNGATRCVTDPADAPAMATLWGEIRKALDATVISKRSGLTFTMAVWKRALDSTMAIRYEKADTLETRAPRPFRAISPVRLLENGYLVQEDGGMWSVFGPDEEILLSDGFLTTHCFAVVAKEERGERLVGLRFEPAPGRGVPEIAGTLWVEGQTSRLRYVEFQYVNLPDQLPRDGVRGRVEFARLPEGWWVVDRWFIRSSRVAETRVLARPFDETPVLDRRRLLLGYLEDGGAILTVEGPPRIRLGAP